jgi:hydrogenase-4 component B
MFYGDGELIDFLFSSFAIILLLGISIIPFVSVKNKPFVSVLTVFLVSIITGLLAVNGLSGNEIEYIIYGGPFFGDIPLRIDALSAWFILIINFTSFTGVLYGAGYLKASAVQSSILNLHWILYVVFQSSMILVSMVQNSIAFIVVWEVMSLSSFLLVLFDYSNPKVHKAGLNYLVQMHISVVLLTVGFIWVYFKTGTFDFNGISLFFETNINIWLFLIFFAGFGLKAGFLGLHTWLPQAHPAAPSHVSGVMSGVIVKMGIYGIIRIMFYIKSDFLLIGEIVLTFSLLTGLYGIMNSSVHRDFKKMLAYCTIENIGIIGIGLGLGLIGIGKENAMLCFLGFGGALLHVLNHSLFKSLLFFSAGSVYRQTHSRDMDKLGGLIKKMPKTALLFFIGAVAIGGLPPLNGFISEFLIYCGILKGINSANIEQITLMILTFAGMSIIGGISILTFSKTFSIIFLGTPRETLKHEPQEVSILMLLPQFLIVLAMIVIAFFPGHVFHILCNVLNANNLPSFAQINSDLNNYIGILRSISIASMVFLGIICLIFFIRFILVKEKEEKYSSTWGCAYNVPNSRLQYTGKSFSKSFGKIMNFLIIEKKRYKEIGQVETFPDSRKYSSFYLDFIENKILDPAIYFINSFINKFQFIQNGKIQAYVIYGIVFILVIFIGTILKLWT